jgi:hypothetical protein
MSTPRQCHESGRRKVSYIRDADIVARPMTVNAGRRESQHGDFEADVVSRKYTVMKDERDSAHVMLGMQIQSARLRRHSPRVNGSRGAHRNCKPCPVRLVRDFLRI